MKEKILDFINSVVRIVLIVILGILVIEGIRSLTTSKDSAKKVGTVIFKERGHDYLVVDTEHGVCVIHAESCPCRLDTLGIYVSDNNDTTYVIKKK